jgi:hypothetical protein
VYQLLAKKAGTYLGETSELSYSSAPPIGYRWLRFLLMHQQPGTRAVARGYSHAEGPDGLLNPASQNIDTYLRFTQLKTCHTHDTRSLLAHFFF